jgi:hypothetical protein
MEDIIEHFYNNCELVEYWHADGHHQDIADYSGDPLEILLALEEEQYMEQ